MPGWTPDQPDPQPHPPSHPDECTDRGLPPDPFPAAMAEMIEGMDTLFQLYQGALDAGFPEERAFQLTSAFLFHALDRNSGPAHE
jgi:hypothetical protein